MANQAFIRITVLTNELSTGMVYAGNQLPQTYTPYPGPSNSASTFSLTCTPNPLPSGQGADCKASAGTNATGTVTFTLLGSTTSLSLDANGQADLPNQLVGASPNVYSVFASYSGDAVHPASSAGVTVVLLASTVMNLAVTSASQAYGLPNILTATVTSSGNVAPTGVLNFYDGSTPIGGSSVRNGMDPYLSRRSHRGESQFIRTVLWRHV